MIATGVWPKLRGRGTYPSGRRERLAMADRVTIRIDAELTDGLERFMAASALPLRSRQDAFRHIVCRWLTSEGYIPASGTSRDGQKPEHSDRITAEPLL